MYGGAFSSKSGKLPYNLYSVGVSLNTQPNKTIVSISISEEEG